MPSPDDDADEATRSVVPVFNASAKPLDSVLSPSPPPADDGNDGDDEQSIMWMPQLELRLPIPFGRVLVLDAMAWASRVCLVGCGWAVAVLIAAAAGHTELGEPGTGGAVFDTLSTFIFAACLGGTAAAIARVPGIAFILLSSVFWTHIGPEIGFLTRGVPPQARKLANQLAVAIIVTRAGLAVNMVALKRLWKPVFGLAVLPLIAEAAVHGVVARFTFKDEFDAAADAGLSSPWTWAFLQGMVCSAIAPGVVVPGYIALRMGGFGKPPGASPAFVNGLELLISSVVLDAVVGLWASNFLGNLVSADPSAGAGPIAWAAALGPIQLVAGALIGALVGSFLHFATTTLLDESGIGKVVPPAADTSPAAEDQWDADERAGEVDAKAGLAAKPLTMSAEQAAVLSIAHTVNIALAALGIGLVCLGDVINLPGGASIAVASTAATVVNLSLFTDPPALTAARAEHVESQSETSATGDNADADVNGTNLGPETGSSGGSGGGGAVNIAPAASTSALWHRRRNPDAAIASGLADDVVSHQWSVAVDSEDMRAAALATIRMRILGTNAWLWEAVAMPFLFAMTGTIADLSELLEPEFLGNVIGPTIAGVVARVVAASLVVYAGSDCTALEALYAGVGWTGKGAVQAALNQIGVRSINQSSHTTAAQKALAMPAALVLSKSAIFVTLLFAPFGCLFVSLAGPHMLRNSNAPAEVKPAATQPSPTPSPSRTPSRRPSAAQSSAAASVEADGGIHSAQAERESPAAVESDPAALVYVRSQSMEDALAPFAANPAAEHLEQESYPVVAANPDHDTDDAPHPVAQVE